MGYSALHSRRFSFRLPRNGWAVLNLLMFGAIFSSLIFYIIQANVISQSNYDFNKYEMELITAKGEYNSLASSKDGLGQIEQKDISELKQGLGMEEVKILNAVQISSQELALEK